MVVRGMILGQVSQVNNPIGDAICYWHRLCLFTPGNTTSHTLNIRIKCNHSDGGRHQEFRYRGDTR